MRLTPVTGAALLVALQLAAAPLGAQRESGDDSDLQMEAPATARSGPTWLIRSPDLGNDQVRIALGVPRDDTVAVHVTEGDVVLDGEFAAAIARQWADSAIAILEATSEREPPSGVARTPVAVGREGITLQLEVMGAGQQRRFGLVVIDSLGLHVVAPELDVVAAHLLVGQMRALGEYAMGDRGPERILYALRPPLFEFQVDKPAVLMEGNPPPRYPESLRQQAVSGEVLVQFVVDTTGRADMHTFKILRGSQPLFALAVRQVLPRYRFLPAEKEGRKVPMYVQMPFKFNIAPASVVDPVPVPARPRVEGWP